MLFSRFRPKRPITELAHRALSTFTDPLQQLGLQLGIDPRRSGQVREQVDALARLADALEAIRTAALEMRADLGGILRGESAEKEQLVNFV